ncbi:MAG: DUF11 domain-containing protein [Anaerolineae bacterium]|nr:DUF11 domain-containing protein [Anaerolineae bacterium]
MIKQTVRRLVDALLLTVLILGTAPPITPITAHPPPQNPPPELITEGASPEENPYLYPADLDPPETCGVPREVPFGEDVEILLGPLNNHTTYRLDQNPSWGGKYHLPVPYMGGAVNAKSPNNVAAVALSADRVVAVWKEQYYDDLPVYSIWTAGSGWQGGILYTESGGSHGPRVRGDPALLSRHPKNWVVFVRDKDDFIQYREWNDGALGPWKTVPGHYDARSDPAVISTGPSHMAVFFKDENGEVLFSEWTGGVGWRNEPISLGKPGGREVYALSVVSRNENHIAVFVATTNSQGFDFQLWYREWTSASGWDDTEWIHLMDDADPTKPAVVSRHANHMGVAVTDGGSVHYKEWTYQSGWKESIELPIAGTGILWPLTLVATSTDEMWVLGLDWQFRLRGNRWSEDGGWSGWTTIHDGWKWTETDQTVLTAVVRQPHDVLVIGREPDNEVVSTHYTTLGREVTAWQQETDVKGDLRAQTIAMVDGKPIWVTVYRGESPPSWGMAALQISRNWLAYGKDLGHAGADYETGKKSVVAADIDGDGDDEVIVATMDASGTSIDVSVVELTVTPRRTNIASSKTTRSGLPLGSDVNVAVGDLDGDGVENEVVVGYRRPSFGIVRILLYQFADGSLQFKESKERIFCSGWVSDLEIAIGQVHPSPAERLIIAPQCTPPGDAPYYVPLSLYYWGQDRRGDRQLTLLQSSEEGNTFTGAEGEYTTALATGDVDADGLEEIIYSYGPYLRVIDANYYFHDLARHPIYRVSASDELRSLAVGDLDQDGKAEIVYAAGNTGWVGVIERADDGSIFRSAARPSNQGSVPLVADLDDDSFEAHLAGCNTFREVSVIAVVNGAPRHYRDGIPVHSSGGGVANSRSASSAIEDGWHVSVGGSLSMGSAHDVAIPGINLKLGEIRESITREFVGTATRSIRTYSSTTETNGFAFGSGESGYSRGMVVYDETTYKCYYYDVYKPGEPENASRAMVCTPTSAPMQTHTSLDHWLSTEFRESAGDSWVEVGHASDDVTLYPSELPVDPYLVRWEGDELQVHGEDVGGFYTNWSIEKSSGGEQIGGGSWDMNTTLSAGVSTAFSTMDVSFTSGVGHQWARSVGWERGLHIEGSVEHFKSSDCPGCASYRVVPYIYQATATTKAGAVYPYLVADYYVPCIGCTSFSSAESPQQIVGLAPQTPVITSTTHPDPDTWYVTNTVTFEWAQPPGDPAVVTGYRWNLDTTPSITPTSLVSVLTTTHTYTDVADGLYYLHLQAQGDGGDYSPVAHRAVRVDANPPQVEFVLDPLGSSGLSDWYNTPLTVTITATDTTGSGVNTVEYRLDSGAWQAYTAPITFVTDTLTTTLWARATDNVGHTSDPVSTTFKLDLSPPSTEDPDGYHLSYASILTDAVGNAQLVLGGVLTDDLSGRLLTEIKLGDTGLWRPVDAVGEFAMLPDNVFTQTSVVTLNWIYSPTFDARGAWTIWGRGLDQAGNYEEATAIAGFYWEPDEEPDLSESQISVTPHAVRPGEVVSFTVGVRNTGYQESLVAVTATLPAELNVLPDTISGGGQYDAGSGAINWSLDALWPGQTRYLAFNAQVDSSLTPTAPLTLETRLDLEGYWTWEDPYGVMPPAPASHYATTTTTLTVPADTSTPTAAPTILDAEVLEGAVVDNPDVTLFVETTPDAEFLYVKEWVWDTISDTWTLAQESGWVRFEEVDGFEVSEDAFSKRGRYRWTLSQGDGVKYLGVWVADGDGHVTNLNEANLIYTNLMRDGTLDAGERVQYRVPLRVDSLTLFNLVVTAGDADLYVWKPRFAFRPHYYSNAAATGFHVETVGFFAPEEGMYIVEVQGVSDGAAYQLLPGGDVAAQETVERGERLGEQLALEEKTRPAHPLTLSTPYSLAERETLPNVPGLSEYTTIYLPLVMR